MVQAALQRHEWQPIEVDSEDEAASTLAVSALATLEAAGGGKFQVRPSARLQALFQRMDA